MGNVGKWPAVQQYRRSFQRLHKIGPQRIPQQGRHSPFRPQIVGRHRLAAAGVAHNHPPQPLFQVHQTL